MGFSLFNIIESFLLLANALAILSEKFLKRCINYFYNWFYVKYIVGLNKPFQGGASGIISPKNQLALMLYFFRVYLKCKNIL